MGSIFVPMQRKLKIGFVSDPLTSFDKQAETTFFLMQEANLRGHEVWSFELKDLFLQNGPKVSAWAQKILVTKHSQTFQYKIIQQKRIDLSKLNVLFLRKDPPVDLKFIHHLDILEVLEKTSNILFINSPSGIKKASEKIYPLLFSGLSPATLVTASLAEAKKFVSLHPQTILKPLNLSGGRGIVKINKLNLSKLFNQATNGEKEFIPKKTRPLGAENKIVFFGMKLVPQGDENFIMLQKFIPEAKKGDKRILLLAGEPLGSFLRVPAKGDFRGNMHSGATWVKSAITARERRLIKRLKPVLLADGLLFVGLDVIGKYITEINVTSPMGIREINQLENSQVEKMTLNWVERNLPH